MRSAKKPTAVERRHGEHHGDDQQAQLAGAEVARRAGASASGQDGGRERGIGGSGLTECRPAPRARGTWRANAACNAASNGTPRAAVLQ